MRTRNVALAAAAVLAAGALSACGSGTKDETTGAASAPATSAPAPKLKGTPIVIGSICSCSGPQASSLGASAKTLEGWAAYRNAQGGINGHPVKVVALDDGGNATRSTQLAKRLVEREHAVAIVGEQSLVDVAWADYVAKKGVPVIGAASYNTTFMTHPGFYSVGAQTPILIYGMVDQAKKAGKTKIGVLPCAEAPACAQMAPLVQAIGAKVIGGVSLSYNSKVSVTQPSYTANCLAARGKGADALLVIENAATVKRVADQCAQQGYKPLQLNISATAGSTWKGSPSMDGTIVTVPNPPLADQSIPATKAFHSALDKYASGVSTSDEYNESNLWVWASGEAFALAAKRAKVGPSSTAATVTKGLHTFRSETVGGLTPPLTFSSKAPAIIPCYYVTQVKGGAFTAPQGAKPICLPPAAAKALGAALKA